MQTYGTSYKWWTLFFPKALRKDVYLLYAFVRQADQLVDEPWGDDLQSREALEMMRQRFHDAYAWKEQDDGLCSLFAQLCREKGLLLEWVDAFFDAMLADTHSKQYTTYLQLQSYMYWSAEVIGLMLARLIGYEPSQQDAVFRAAKKLGEAMQYTNFLRDIKEDWILHKRLYIPLDRLDACGLDHDTLIAYSTGRMQISEDRKIFMEWELLHTETLYQEALAWIPLLDNRWRFAVWVAAMLYAGILWKIRKIDYDVFVHDAHTTRREKCRLFLGALKTYKKF